MKAQAKRFGFTLVELLVVVAIMGVVVALLLPAVQAARESSRSIQCRNNLKQIGLAILGYHDTFRKFPVGQYVDEKGHGWGSAILPYLEQQNLYNLVDYDVPYWDPVNRVPGGTVVSSYICPSMSTYAEDREGSFSRGFAAIDYGCMLGAVSPLASPPNSNRVIPFTESHGIFPWPKVGAKRTGAFTRFSSIRDGASATILVGEDSGRGVRDGGIWIAGASLIDQQLPGINITNDNELFSDHPSGVNVVYADGSSRLLSETIDLRVLVGICNRDDGMVLQSYE